MLTRLIFFGPVFYGLSDGGIFQFNLFHFQHFSFLVKHLEQKKRIALYEILQHFRRPRQKHPYMYLTVWGNKSFLAAVLP